MIAARRGLEAMSVIVLPPQIEPLAPGYGPDSAGTIGESEELPPPES
jgi:hypothetical protein